MKTTYKAQKQIVNLNSFRYSNNTLNLHQICINDKNQDHIHFIKFLRTGKNLSCPSKDMGPELIIARHFYVLLTNPDNIVQLCD